MIFYGFFDNTPQDIVLREVSQSFDIPSVSLTTSRRQIYSAHKSPKIYFERIGPAKQEESGKMAG